MFKTSSSGKTSSPEDMTRRTRSDEEGERAVARIVQESGDVVSSGFRMGRYVATESSEKEKWKPTQSDATDQLGYVFLAALLLGLVVLLFRVLFFSFI